MTANELAGRLALVTGARRPRGIGLAAARALARAGADVVAADLCRRGGEPDPAAWEQMQAGARGIEALGRRALALDLDVTRADEIASALERVEAAFGRPVDVLVNAAGVVSTTPALDLSEAEWQRVMDVNARGTLLACQAVARRLVARGLPGRIVNVASRSGKLGSPLHTAYCASKFAVVGITQCLAVEWAPLGIAVNAVCPGLVDTDMLDEVFEGFAAGSGTSVEAMRAQWLSAVPLGRLATPEEVADTIVFLASPRARYVTGESLIVTGGMLV